MIKLIKSTFYEEEQTKQDLAEFILKTDWLSYGPQCEAFERQFAQIQGRSDCIMVNSGSSANLAIIQALLNLGKLLPGDLVGFSAVTWSTNVMPLIQLGLTPIPIDVDLRTLNVPLREIEHVVKKFPLKALFITNLLGLCADLDAIADYCRTKRILLIEDTCESLGSVYRGTKLGNFGLAGTFSFYVGHHLSTVEGGAICTNDEVLAEMIRMVRAHGWDRNLSKIKQDRIRNLYQTNSTFYSRYTFYDLGYNFRPTEFAGFLGNRQLPYLPEIVKKRQHNYQVVTAAVYQATNAYLPIASKHMDVFSSFAMPFLCKKIQDKDRVVEACEGKIELRPIVGGDIGEQPFFRKHIQTPVPATPQAHFIHTHGFYIGNNPELTEQDLQTMTKVLSTAVAE